MSFSIQDPKEGDALTLSAVIHNSGIAAAGFDVSMYDGDPATGGTLLLQETVLDVIPSGGRVTLGFGISTAGFAGIHEIYIVADPVNKIDEVNESNNIAWSRLSIAPSGMALQFLRTGVHTRQTIM